MYNISIIPEIKINLKLLDRFESSIEFSILRRTHYPLAILKFTISLNLQLRKPADQKDISCFLAQG